MSQAQVAESVDALVSGTSSRKGVKVRVLSWAPSVSASQSTLIQIVTLEICSFESVAPSRLCRSGPELAKTRPLRANL